VAEAAEGRRGCTARACMRRSSNRGKRRVTSGRRRRTAPTNRPATKGKGGRVLESCSQHKHKHKEYAPTHAPAPDTAVWRLPPAKWAACTEALRCDRAPTPKCVAMTASETRGCPNQRLTTPTVTITTHKPSLRNRSRKGEGGGGGGGEVGLAIWSGVPRTERSHRPTHECERVCMGAEHAPTESPQPQTERDRKRTCVREGTRRPAGSRNGLTAAKALSGGVAPKAEVAEDASASFEACGAWNLRNTK
jgi:hypothetical protein